MGLVNVTVLMIVGPGGPQKFAIQEEGKEATRMIRDFLAKLRLKRTAIDSVVEEQEFLEFTSPKYEGSRKIYFREDMVQSILVVNEASVPDPTAPEILRPELSVEPSAFRS